MKNKYIKIIFQAWFILSSIHIYGQVQDINKDSTQISKSKLTISDFAHIRTFGTSEQHSNFTMKYNINPKFSFELQGSYDTYILADVFKVSFLPKKYFSKRLYLFSGVEIESERDKLSLNLSPPPQLKLKNGIGYDLNTNFQLQFEQELHFNKSKVGIYSNPRLFSLKGKVNF